MKHFYCKVCLLFAFLCIFGQVLYGQHLWLGLQAGLSHSNNTQIKEGQYAAPGMIPFDYFGGAELKYQFPSRLGIGLGFQLSDFSVGAKSKLENQNFGVNYAYCGHFSMNDLYLGLSYSLPILKDRLFVRPELAYHQLLGNQTSNARGTVEDPYGWGFSGRLQLHKPYFYSMVSGGLNLDWQFKNGCFLRIGGKYLQGFGSIGQGEIVCYLNRALKEFYDFKIVPAALQTYIGFDYPISKFWEK